MELEQLAKPPFTDVKDQGIFGIFNDEDQDKIIRIIEEVNVECGCGVGFSS